MSDPVADALIRIKNGYLAQRIEVNLPYSKFIIAVCEVLLKAGYLAEHKVIPVEGKSVSQIQVKLRYEVEAGSSKKKPAISHVRKISKPGLRVYKGHKGIPHVLNGLGIAIISTPKGVMTDKQARKEGVGGEVVAYIW